jgi:hypothetical protein
MLRITDDEGEGDERTANDGTGGNQEPVDASTGTEAGTEAAIQQLPIHPAEPQPQGDARPPPEAQEGNKTSTLSLSEIKKAVMDISNNTATGDMLIRQRRGSEPGVSVPGRRFEAGTDTAYGSGPGFKSVPATKNFTPSLVNSGTGSSKDGSNSDLENDIFTDPSQESARAPAVRVS